MKRKATLIRVFGYLLQHKGRLAFILSLSFLGNLLALAGPRLSGAAINLIAEGMDGSMDLPGVYKYAFFMLLFYIASSLMSYVVNVSMITLSRRITYTFKKGYLQPSGDASRELFRQHHHRRHPKPHLL